MLRNCLKISVVVPFGRKRPRIERVSPVKHAQCIGRLDPTFEVVLRGFSDSFALLKRFRHF